MGKFDYMPYTTNLPAGVGAEVAIEAMDEYDRMDLGRITYRFAKNMMQNPAMREAINAKVTELRAEGFFDQHPVRA